MPKASPQQAADPLREVPRDAPAPVAPWGPRVALVGLLAVTALLRIRLLAVPLERDEGEYAYVGQLILQGEVPYLAAHNMKLPGVYYAYAAILAVLGETDVAIHLGLLLVNLVAIVLLYQLGRTLLDVTAGLSAGAAYAVLSLSESVSGFAANAEHFVIPPVLGGVLLLARAGERRRLGHLAGAGLLLGLGFVMKQHAAAFVAFGALSLLLVAPGRGRAGWRRTAAEGLVLALATLVPFGLTCLGMALAGAFAPFWFWTFTYAREYVAIVPLAVGLRQLGVELARLLSASPALWALAAVGATALWWSDGARRAAPFIGLFVACSFLAVSTGLRFSDHYFLLFLPAASLLLGAAVSAAAGSAAARRRRLVGAARVGIPLAAVGLTLAQAWSYLFTLPPAAISRRVYGANPFPEAIEIARYLREHSRPDDRVAVIGSEPEIYFYARRRAATSYIYAYPLMEPHPFARRMQEEMIAQLERARPRFMVLVNVDTSWSMRPDSPRLVLTWAETVVNDGYRAVGVADIVPDGTTTYRWDAEAHGAAPRSRFHVMIFERRS